MPLTRTLEARKKVAVMLVVMATVVVVASSCSDEVNATPTPEPTPTPGFPLLDLQFSVLPSAIAAGDTVEVRTDAGGSGLAQYTLLVKGVSISRVQYDGTLVSESTSDEASVIDWSAGPSSATWTLQIHDPGSYIIGVFVTGEVAISSSGPFIFTHRSKELSLTVN